MMHPELANIQNRYERILDDNEAGHISVEQAMSMIAQLTTIDGDGFVWSMDPSTGSFMRAQAGGVPQPADPGMFTPAQIDGGGRVLGGMSGAGTPDLMRPPTGGAGVAPLPHGFGSPDQGVGDGGQYGTAPGAWGGMPGAPGMPGAMGDPMGGPGMPGPMGVPMGGPGMPGQMPGPMGGPMGGGPSFPDVTGGSPPSGGKGMSMAGVGGMVERVEGMLRGKWRTIAIIALVIVVIILVTRHSSAPSSTTGIPSSPTTTAPAAPGSTTTGAPAPPPVPSVSAMETILATIGAGSASQASGVIVVPGDSHTLARQVALYAGMAHTGLSVTTSAASSQGGVQSAITVTNHANGDVVYKGTASWSKDGGTWKLSNWPTLTAT